MSIDPDIQQMVTTDIRATRAAAVAAVDSWVTSPDGLGVLFSRRAYTLYGLAQRSRPQDPYTRSGELRRHVMAPGRVRAAGDDPFRVVWWADARPLNFMKGKNAVYRDQFENVPRQEMDGLDKVIQARIDKVE